MAAAAARDTEKGQVHCAGHADSHDHQDATHPALPDRPVRQPLDPEEAARAVGAATIKTTGIEMIQAYLDNCIVSGKMRRPSARTDGCRFGAGKS
jgi:hypothetical protein